MSACDLYLSWEGSDLCVQGMNHKYSYYSLVPEDTGIVRHVRHT